MRVETEKTEPLLRIIDALDDEEIARRLRPSEIELVSVLREHGAEGVAERLYIAPATVETMFVNTVRSHLTGEWPRDL